MMKRPVSWNLMVVISVEDMPSSGLYMHGLLWKTTPWEVNAAVLAKCQRPAERQEPSKCVRSHGASCCSLHLDHSQSLAFVAPLAHCLFRLCLTLSSNHGEYDIGFHDTSPPAFWRTNDHPTNNFCLLQRWWLRRRRFNCSVSSFVLPRTAGPWVIRCARNDRLPGFWLCGDR